ncbi:MAG: hypothetical protein GTN50_00430 [Candidatus Latescibacteria bacterium]|nr:hypothetical protein [Candidatus Latescibacterota bacterium]
MDFRRIASFYLFLFLYILFAFLMRGLLIFASLPVPRVWMATIILIAVIPFTALGIISARFIGRRWGGFHMRAPVAAALLLSVLVIVIGLNSWDFIKSRRIPSVEGRYRISLT